MIAPADLLRVLLAPALVAAVIAGIGRWRNWAWAMPLAVGAGFLTGYSLIFIPQFRPRDGIDWLFWAAIPVTLLGVLDAVLNKRWGWILGLACAGVMALITWPLDPQAVPMKALLVVLLPATAMGVLACAATAICHPRIPTRAIVAGYAIIVGGAAIIVMSSNIRIVGLYGLAAAAALGAVAIFMDNERSARSVGLVAYCILVGLLTCGIYYVEQGVTATNVAVILGAPVALMAGFFIPGHRQWLRAAVSLIAVAVLVSAVAIPTALKAKQAAEQSTDDGLNTYYGQ